MEQENQNNEESKEFGDGIINIDNFRFKKQYKQNYCRHERKIYDPQKRIINCEDCGQYIDHFDAFLSIVEKIGRIYARLNSIRREVHEAQQKEIVLLAAKEVEKAWRRKNMVPTCPHCHEAIFPTDGFGGSYTNKQMALESRKFKKNNINK